MTATIGPDTARTNNYWLAFSKEQFQSSSNCQYKVSEGENILYAFTTLNVDRFLRLSGPTQARVKSVLLPLTSTIYELTCALLACR